ncbi:MAG: OstA-like protein [bacterium]
MRRIIFVAVLISMMYNVSQAQKLTKTAPEIPVLDNADRVVVYNEAGNRVAILEGNVKFSSKAQNVVLSADSAEYNIDTNVAAAYGNVILKSGEQEIRSDYIIYNFNTNQGIAGRGFGVLKSGGATLYTKGERAENIADQQFYIANGTITTCDSILPHYYIWGSDILVTEKVEWLDEQWLAKNMILYVGGVPLLYAPYFRRTLAEEKEKFDIEPGYNSADGFTFQTTWNHRWNDNALHRSRGKFIQKKGWEGDLELDNTLGYHTFKLSGTEYVRRNIENLPEDRPNRLDEIEAGFKNSYTLGDPLGISGDTHVGDLGSGNTSYNYNYFEEGKPPKKEENVTKTLTQDATISHTIPLYKWQSSDRDPVKWNGVTGKLNFVWNREEIDRPGPPPIYDKEAETTLFDTELRTSITPKIINLNPISFSIRYLRKTAYHKDGRYYSIEEEMPSVHAALSQQPIFSDPPVHSLSTSTSIDYINYHRYKVQGFPYNRYDYEKKQWVDDNPKDNDFWMDLLKFNHNFTYNPNVLEWLFITPAVNLQGAAYSEEADKRHWLPNETNEDPGALYRREDARWSLAGNALSTLSLSTEIYRIDEPFDTKTRLSHTPKVTFNYAPNPVIYNEKLNPAMNAQDLIYQFGAVSSKVNNASLGLDNTLQAKIRNFEGDLETVKPASLNFATNYDWSKARRSEYPDYETDSAGNIIRDPKGNPVKQRPFSDVKSTLTLDPGSIISRTVTPVWNTLTFTSELIFDPYDRTGVFHQYHKEYGKYTFPEIVEREKRTPSWIPFELRRAFGEWANDNWHAKSFSLTGTSGWKVADMLQLDLSHSFNRNYGNELGEGMSETHTATVKSTVQLNEWWYVWYSMTVDFADRPPKTANLFGYTYPSQEFGVWHDLHNWQMVFLGRRSSGAVWDYTLRIELKPFPTQVGRQVEFTEKVFGKEKEKPGEEIILPKIR